ncbi:Holliday junction resolvase RuvX [Planctomycetota bacterium]
MRYLGIDYGLKRLGLALCDASETIVSPLCQLSVNTGRPEELLERLKQIIDENQVEALVVGLPLNMDDSEGEQARLTRRFAGELAKTVGKPVHLQDERLSSMAAEEKLSESGLSRQKRRQRRDMLAACDILQEFLNRRQKNDSQ